MNDKIYNHGSNFADYAKNYNLDSNIKEPFHIKNDYEFNRQLAEIKAHEKELMKHDPKLLNERLQEVSIF